MEKTHDEEMAIDLWELISALKKRALIILAACLLGGVVAGLFGRKSYQKRDYRAVWQ